MSTSRRLADLEMDALHAPLGESRRRHREIDVARWNVRQRKVAGGVGLRLACETRPLIDDTNLCGDTAFLRIEHTSPERR